MGAVHRPNLQRHHTLKQRCLQHVACVLALAREQLVSCEQRPRKRRYERKRRRRLEERSARRKGRSQLCLRPQHRLHRHGCACLHDLRPCPPPYTASSFDRNVYWGSAGRIFFPGNLSLAGWQRRGQDAHSAVADPLLDSNISSGNVQPGSPALRCGFVNIDASTVGPRLTLAAHTVYCMPLFILIPFSLARCLSRISSGKKRKKKEEERKKKKKHYLFKSVLPPSGSYPLVDSNNLSTIRACKLASAEDALRKAWSATRKERSKTKINIVSVA